ncbi:hypothetical protein [Bifidobacterium bombi]|uniref:Lipoprotein n=1 Tax=Bifidobacterium bombi DSM 19703 TaxID=1341695 RepID=A0A080N4Q7_9BIFI|nr:hypothetical protein [Bifidobacterium bombi]KFF31625.1 hypothetical protein BBOMB_1010 [Bifidobacterium bombi DSM 19703]
MKKPIAILTCLALLVGVSACGSKHSTLQNRTSATLKSKETEPKLKTLPDGLSGTCAGDPYAPNNNLQKVDLNTTDGQLNISIPNATDMMLVDVGYYVNIYTKDFKQTQIKIEYHQSEDKKEVTVAPLFGNAKITKIGGFNVDSSDENLLNVSVPTNLIAGNKHVTWNAALDMNGKDIAFCPGQSKEEKVPLQ